MSPTSSQVIALCSSVAAAQKPQPRDRTCANSVVWVVLMLLIGSLISAFYCIALLALYMACVCPSCAVGQPGAIFDTYAPTIWATLLHCTILQVHHHLQYWAKHWHAHAGLCQWRAGALEPVRPDV